MVRGRVTVHRLENGSTTAQQVSLSISSETNHHWAQEQATQGGDLDAFSPGSCFASQVYSEISKASYQYCRVFDKDCPFPMMDWDGTNGELSHPNDNFDFEVKVPEDHVRNFLTHYAERKTYLTVNLEVIHPSETRHCLFGQEETADEECIEHDGDVDLVEEGLWDAWTPIWQSKPRCSFNKCGWRRPTYTVSAKIPITVVGASISKASDSKLQPPIHYLEPGVQAPLILSNFPPSTADLEFPPSLPTFIVEAAEKTTQRMLVTPSTTSMRWTRFYSSSSDTSSEYNSGDYAGVLWRKKLLSEASSAQGAEQDSRHDSSPYRNVDTQTPL